MNVRTEIKVGRLKALKTIKVQCFLKDIRINTKKFEPLDDKNFTNITSIPNTYHNCDIYEKKFKVIANLMNPLIHME